MVSRSMSFCRGSMPAEQHAPYNQGMKLQIRAVIVYTYRVAYIYIREDISTK
jgi:hypothetical protein